MLRNRIAICLTLLAAMVQAQEVLTADEFQSLSEGRTLHFTLDGFPYGAEMFFPGRRSLWRRPDGQCDSGTWTARGPDICFTYEVSPAAQCWRFTREAGGVRAYFIEDGRPVRDLVVLDRTDDSPLDCPGPRIGS